MKKLVYNEFNKPQEICDWSNENNIEAISVVKGFSNTASYRVFGYKNK